MCRWGGSGGGRKGGVCGGGVGSKERVKISEGCLSPAAGARAPFFPPGFVCFFVQQWQRTSERESDGGRRERVESRPGPATINFGRGSPF